MTLNPVCESVETSEGVPVTVTGVAQCKIMRQPDILRTACEQFLGKSVQHIQSVILQTLEGHLRAILGEFMNLVNKWSYVHDLFDQTVCQNLNSYKDNNIVSQ